jgi:hypothetical protein
MPTNWQPPACRWRPLSNVYALILTHGRRARRCSLIADQFHNSSRTTRAHNTHIRCSSPFRRAYPHFPYVPPASSPHSTPVHPSPHSSNQNFLSARPHTQSHGSISEPSNLRRLHKPWAAPSTPPLPSLAGGQRGSMVL